MPLCKPCKQCYTSISDGISYQNCISLSRSTPYITFPCVGGQEVERAKKQESANWVVCNQSRTRICQENVEKFRPNCRANCQLHAPPLKPHVKCASLWVVAILLIFITQLTIFFQRKYKKLTNAALESKHICWGWMAIRVVLDHETAQ